ncbi:hypothetical protein DV735_g3349, partial [Chaetothyriales sp. CBS 134920]
MDTKSELHPSLKEAPVQPLSDESLDSPPGSPSPSPEKKRGKLETTVLMVALCMSVFLAALDMTILGTALPTIAEHFQSIEVYVWVGSAFLLASGASMPTWGKLSDIWGRKALLLLATAVFFLGSALCAAATSSAMLIAGRTVQGVGSGGLLSLVNIVIGDLFSPRDRGVYYGIIGMMWALASSIGPVIGGALTEKVSWRWCFYINLPVSAVTFVVIILTLHLQTPKTPIVAGLKAIDWLGSLTIAGATTLFLLGLQFGGVKYAWSSPAVICLIIFGGIAFIIFFFIESRARYPLMPLRIFATKSNLALLAINFAHAAPFMEAGFFIPTYFQAVLSASPLLSAVWLFPWILSVSFFTAGGGIYIKKTGRYFDCMVFSLLTSLLGYALLYNLPNHKGWAKIVIYQLIAGIGSGMNFQAPLVALQSSSIVTAQDNGTVTATYSFIRTLTYAIGVVIGSAILSNRMNSHRATLEDALGSTLAERFSGRDAQANIPLIESLPTAAQRQTVRQAYYESIQTIWIQVACIIVIGLVALPLVERKRQLSRTHEEVRTGLEAEEHRRTLAQKPKVKEEEEG